MSVVAETNSIAPLVVPLKDAARMLSMSDESFDRYARRELRLIRRGRLILVPVSELQAWVARSAAKTLEDEELGL